MHINPRVAFLVAAVCGTTVGTFAEETTPRKLNVLFVAVDDLKPALGCYGDPLAKTPHIDRLATRGTRFERAYCMQAVCSPSRNALLTGLRPEVLRIYDLGTNFRKRAPDVVTLPQWFKQHGYAAHGIGKIFHVGHGNHEDPASWSVPHFHAKTVAYALPENKAQLTREEALFGNAEYDMSKLPRGAAYENADVSDDSYGDGIIAREAIQRLREFKKSGEPFFLAVGFLRPHLPFCAPKKYWDMHDPKNFPIPERATAPAGAPQFAPSSWGELRQYSDIPDAGPLDATKARTLIHGYYAATSYMDAQFGRVLDELDELGLAESTIIVLWGDHGWHLGDHGMWCKHTTYEQATRAPLIVVAPGKPHQPTVSALVEFVDVYPTICDLAALQKPAHLQGVSLLPLLNNPVAHGRQAVFQVYPRSPKGMGPLLGQAVRSDRWRYVEWQKKDDSRAVVARELYDMLNDSGETLNLAEKPEHADVVAKQGKLLQERLAAPPPAGLKLVDPLPKETSAANTSKANRDALFARKDKDGDGKLTREEFLTNQPDPMEAPKRFIRFDADHDGVLTRAEFVNMGGASKP